MRITGPEALVLTAVLVAACSSSNPAKDARYVEQYYEQLPGIVLPLPVDLPDGATFLGFSGFFSSNGRVTSRDAQFRTRSGDQVSLCISDPATRQCPEITTEGATYRVRTREGVVLDLSPLPASERSEWASLILTDDMTRLSWLDR